MEIIKMKDIAVFGAGGFGREVLTIIKAINKVEFKYNILGFFDDGEPIGKIINGYPVLGGVDALQKWGKGICVVVAIGGPAVKRKIVEKISNNNVEFPTLIHPHAIIGDDELVDIGKGCIICAGTIITVNVRIEDFVILNLGCTVGHDTHIGEYASFMPSVNISGEVNIGKGVYVGTGAKIINRLTIGNDTVVGAGAVVVKALPENCTAVGVPAKVIK